eukprot:5150032-Pleurochrysis_carterae.AAC.1
MATRLVQSGLCEASSSPEMSTPIFTPNVPYPYWDSQWDLRNAHGVSQVSLSPLQVHPVATLTRAPLGGRGTYSSFVTASTTKRIGTTNCAVRHASEPGRHLSFNQKPCSFVPRQVCVLRATYVPAEVDTDYVMPAVVLKSDLLSRAPAMLTWRSLQSERLCTLRCAHILSALTTFVQRVRPSKGARLCCLSWVTKPDQAHTRTYTRTRASKHAGMQSAQVCKHAHAQTYKQSRRACGAKALQPDLYAVTQSLSQFVRNDRHRLAGG